MPAGLLYLLYLPSHSLPAPHTTHATCPHHPHTHVQRHLPAAAKHWLIWWWVWLVGRCLGWWFWFVGLLFGLGWVGGWWALFPSPIPSWPHAHLPHTTPHFPLPHTYTDPTFKLLLLPGGCCVVALQLLRMPLHTHHYIAFLPLPGLCFPFLLPSFATRLHDISWHIALRNFAFLPLPFTRLFIFAFCIFAVLWGRPYMTKHARILWHFAFETFGELWTWQKKKKEEEENVDSMMKRKRHTLICSSLSIL